MSTRKTVQRLMIWLKRHGQIWNSLIIGGTTLLTTRVLDEMAISGTDFQDVLFRVFSVTNRSTNLLSWLALVAFVVGLIAPRLLSRYYRRQSYDSQLVQLLMNHVSGLISRHDNISLGDVLTLEHSPFLHRGWQPDDVRVLHRSIMFSMPREYRDEYQTYKEENFEEKRFFDDGTKLMLTSNPHASTDSPTLVLNIQESLYSQNLFYQEVVAKSIETLQTLIDQVVEDNEIAFPHSLCLHLLVSTNDDSLLLVRRSSKVHYYPRKWSTSIEEQASLEDLSGPADRIIARWVQRAMWQELGIRDDLYNQANIRILSVFLEAGIPNISLLGHVVLDVDVDFFRKSGLHKSLRPDHEFTVTRFLTPEEVYSEMRSPQRDYHPTSRYRMLFFLLRVWGEEKLMQRLKARRV